MAKKNYLLLWADSSMSIKSRRVNAPYHFIHFGEIASYVNKRVDGNLDCIDIEATELEFGDLIKRFIDKKYDAVALYLNTENLQNSLNILKYLKEISPDCKAIAYGEMPLYLPKLFKNTQFDAIVDCNCDQEVAIEEFFKYTSGVYSKDDLHGMLLVENHQLIPTQKGILLDPSEWEFATDELVPIEDYFKMEKRRMFVCTISRGCPYNCPYCNAVKYYGKTERRRNVDDLIKFINSHDYEFYKFFAPNFTLNEKEAFELCKELIANNKKIKWSCTTRPDLLQNEELIELMAMAGCVQIAIGIESIDKKDLNSINKRYNEKLILDGIRALKKNNIEYKALIMFGVPNQTKESINYTLDFLYGNDLTVRATAYTPFYEMNHYMTPDQISKYDKRTYYDGIDNMNYSEFLNLIYDTENYKKTLKLGDNNV